MNHVKAISAYLVTFLVVDSIWINLFAMNVYQREVGALMAESPRLIPALIFYVGYAAAALVLVIKPAKTVISTIINGAVLGAVAYGTFAVSNYALLQSWTVKLMLIDTIFGTIVTALCCAVAFKFYAGSRS